MNERRRQVREDLFQMVVAMANPRTPAEYGQLWRRYQTEPEHVKATRQWVERLEYATPDMRLIAAAYFMAAFAHEHWHDDVAVVFYEHAMALDPTLDSGQRVDELRYYTDAAEFPEFEDNVWFESLCRASARFE